jgi:hypothetical protein
MLLSPCPAIFPIDRMQDRLPVLRLQQAVGEDGFFPIEMAL